MPTRRSRATWSVLVALLLALVVTSAPPAGAQSRLPGDGPAALGRYRIGIGATPVDVAIDMSRAVFDDGEAAQVVIGRDDGFADSLAGAVLTGGTGPLLYVPGGAAGQLPQSVADEVARVLGPPGGCADGPDVFILGGTSAVSTAVEEALTAQDRCTERFAGASRVETSVAIATYVLDRFPTTRLLLARDDQWADAATGGAYATYSGTPIVVTSRTALHPAVEGLLAGRGWNDLVLLGGEAALSADVMAEVGAHGPTRRVAGDARDLPAVAIATDLWARTEQVTVVNGYTDDGWVYALAGASPAAALAAPQLYVQQSAAPSSTLGYAEDRGPLDLVVGLGSTAEISDAVIESLGASGPVHDGQGGGDQPPPAGGAIPTGTYVCWQDGVYPFENMDIVDASTYASQSGGAGTYTYDAGANDIQFTSGPYASWVERGEYHPDGVLQPGDGPTIVLYYLDEDGESERILCYLGED
ncbi:cell wall-binding repeat-containing protein [Euzebya sp.]|uniref:cell wall-binding repeat-containing protein n=1 Tax=Euzebya sp. TaxID=1971409 RepID=UPI003510E3D4